MSVKADFWIRRMAKDQAMIAPFVDGQVKYHENGHGIVSYGLSSYGYDVRCAPEFKIFTNINSAIVDPKAFSEDSFVNFYGNECIIPPNSFALARTIEYFRIPRNVLTICLGKSTYARCFSGNTKVALVDGSSPTLEEMATRSQNGEDFWGYSIGQYGQMLVTHLEAPRYTGRSSLLEIMLDNKQVIHCTPDHQFMLRDGVMCEANKLRAGTSLMPLYRQITRGYEQVYQPLTNHLISTHRLADAWNIKHNIYDDTPLNSHRHHIDHDRRNNRPWNIIRMNSGEHIQQVIQAFKGNTKGRNHKVSSVRTLLGEHDVYCVTVPEAGNFALDAGVIVHNCGIIVNVTPLEPEWEGHVTLEFSNTTPLPARIYAGEGVAQMIFFESDEVCEISYADRKGKYQGQTGVTVPKL